MAWKLSKIPIELEDELSRPDGWKDRAIEALRAYNLCAGQACERSGRPFYPKRAVTDGVVDIFWGLVRWCQSRDLDAVTWIYVVHQAIGGRLPASQGHLFSEKMIRHYQDGFQGPNFQSASGLKNTIASTGMVKTKVPPTGAEIARRHYAARDQADLCKFSIDITLGFDVASPTCQACSERVACNRFKIRMESP
jgi:hypothetical protein